MIITGKIGMFYIGMAFVFSANLSYSRDYDLIIAEDSLKTLFISLANTGSADESVFLNQQIIRVLKNTLKNPDSFDYPFDSLPSLGSIYASDGKLRIFTWNFSCSPSEYNYSGFLQFREKESDEISLFFLNQIDTTRESLDSELFNHQSWYGALYYQVHTVMHSGKTYYTLIGFDLNNVFTNRKIVDILAIVEGSPVFGSPMFYFQNEIKHRIVFEYSSRVVMFLRYVSEKDMIVFDHLSPGSPRLIGQYRYYGPDFSYDALRFQNGRWVHIPDIDWKK